ncbi:hypothetical protein LSAT2_032371, partial [Lamellibrachia satsuma]
MQIWILFVDYIKVFETVTTTPGNNGWSTNPTAKFKVSHVLTMRFLSPMLFNYCSEKIMRMVKAQLKERSGCVIGGRAVWNLRCAENARLITRPREELMYTIGNRFKT